MPYRVISAFTKSSPYEEIIKPLEDSLKSHNILHTIYPFDSLGSWAKNCQMKAELILKALSENPENIVWIDADAIVTGALSFFENLKADFSCYFMKTKYNPNELLSGTLYFSNSEESKKFIRRWITKNKTNSEWDQRNLQSTFEENHPSWIPLPVQYIHINGFERHQGFVEKPLITHFQASRVNRNWEGDLK